MPEDHVLVRIAREIHRDCQAGARSGDLRLLVTSPEFKALPQFQQDVAHTVCGLEERLEWISELLKIVVEKLADADYLTRICTPEVLADQLQDVLDDDELILALHDSTRRYSAAKHSRLIS